MSQVCIVILRFFVKCPTETLVCHPPNCGVLRGAIRILLHPLVVSLRALIY